MESKKIKLLVILFLFSFLILSCCIKEQKEEKISFDVAKEDKVKMKIKSSAFEQNGKIPIKYTCQGQDINPPLEFSEIPKEAKSLALIMDDPDAPLGTWDHWIIWNIPPETKEILEGEIPKNAIQGQNSWKKNSYGGPCPPSGVHRYFFKLYALDTILNIKENSKKSDLEKAMQGHILAKAELIGLYEKI
ncbi:MAG: YbhB/YbcL family Raf kinase inhibitor-like protein [Candidatus Altiarchaeota archaeon]